MKSRRNCNPKLRNTLDNCGMQTMNQETSSSKLPGTSRDIELAGVPYLFPPDHKLISKVFPLRSMPQTRTGSRKWTYCPVPIGNSVLIETIDLLASSL